MIFKIVRLFFLPLFLSASSFSTGTAPNWVKPYSFPLENIPLRSSQISQQTLLVDWQTNWKEQQHYYHSVDKLLTREGVEDAAQLQISFDPSYEELIVHSVQIFRNGKQCDRLQNARFELLQKEEDLSRNIYRGELTLVYFLEDIREGDILEYSYSLVEKTLAFISHRYPFQWSNSVEHVVYRLLAPPDCFLQIRPFHIDIEPTVTDLTPTLREWSLEAFATPIRSYESDVPDWYNQRSYVQISQYRDWQEVAQQKAAYYILPDSTQPPDELAQMIDSWKRSTPDPAERALLALRFVQDQIRYLSMDGSRPRDPRLVFQQRFGDCKDKALLLHAILKWMDISSTPALVHTGNGKLLPSYLPAPLFNHVILQITLGNSSYWVDPTHYLQGGTLVTNYCPPYDWALSLTKETTQLAPLPQPTASPIELQTSYRFTSETSLQVTTTASYYNSEADSLRRSIRSMGKQRFTEKYLAAIQEVYPEASTETPLRLIDDRLRNKITISGSYTLSIEGPPDSRKLRIFSWTLRTYLDTNLNPARNAPYLLRHPLWVKEYIHIDNPFLTWTNVKDELHYEHECIDYSYFVQGDDHTFDFYFELKHPQDHVPISALDEYWEIVNEIQDKAPYSLTVSP